MRLLQSTCFLTLVVLSARLMAQDSANGDALNAILAQLPAKEFADEQRIFNELMGLGQANISRLAGMVLPNGQEAGIKARYGVALLTHTVSDPQQRIVLESAYVSAMQQAHDAEVKQYFLSNLRLVGSERTIILLKALISDEALFDHAVSAIVTIGGDEAKKAILSSLQEQSPVVQLKLIKSLGTLQYEPAVAPITAFAKGTEPQLRRQALWSLAMIGDASSSTVLLQQAKAAGFKYEPTEATVSLVEYMHQLERKGNKKLTIEVAQAILANTKDASQQQFRLAALKKMVAVAPESSLQLLVKESAQFDDLYQKEVMKCAIPTARTATGVRTWSQEYKKASGQRQAGLLALLTDANTDVSFLDAQVIPALRSASPETRQLAASKLAASRNSKYKQALLDYLTRSADAGDLTAATVALGQITSKDDGALIAQRLSAAGDAQKIALVRLLASKRATDQFDIVRSTAASGNDSVSLAGYRALPYVSTADNVPTLLELLSTAKTVAQTEAVQRALIASVDVATAPKVIAAYDGNKAKLLPVLPYTPDKSALDKVLGAISEGDQTQQQAAFNALINWPDEKVITPLLNIRKDPALKQYHAAAGTAVLSHVTKAPWPNDKKLQLIRELMSLATTRKEKTEVLRAAGTVRTLPSLIFVSRYLDDPELGSVASRPAMQIALPASDGRPGLTGEAVRNVLSKMADKLNGPDSQYERIDILTYLEKLPPSIAYTVSSDEAKLGFQPLFNGKDLDNWVGNKIDYVVEDNAIALYPGEGHGNLYTAKEYSDFVLRFEFQLTPGANNGLGIHAPLEGDAAYAGKEIQILDNSAAKYADLQPWQYHGSLYGIMAAKRDYLKPVGEWNEQEVQVKGDVIKVTLNGTVILEGNMKKAAAKGTADHKDHPGLKRRTGHIGFLGHGDVVRFRNLRIHELK